MGKKLYLITIVLGLFIGISLNSFANTKERAKLEKTEAVLLRGMTDIDEGKKGKIDKVFSDYSKDIVKIAQNKKLNEKSKIKSIQKARKQRDKKMEKTLNRNQWKVYENNLKILDEEYKKMGIDPKKGVELNILD